MNKEEQKKAWQAQSSRNVLAKKTAEAFKIEKIPLTKEEKKAKWKADSTGKAIDTKNCRWKGLGLRVSKVLEKIRKISIGLVQAGLVKCRAELHLMTMAEDQAYCLNDFVSITL